MDNWLHALKIAVIEEDLERLERLQNEMPRFAVLAELEAARALIGQALTLLKREAQKKSTAINEIRKTIAFQKSTLFKERRFNKTY